MLKTNLKVSIIILKALSDVINKDRVDNRFGDKKKNFLIFFALPRLIRADNLTFGAKKTVNVLQNTFI